MTSINKIQHTVFAILVTALLCSCSGTKQTTAALQGADIINSPDFIFYGTAPLTWDDFKGRVKSKHFNAGTYAGISYVQQPDGAWKVFSYFNKNKSFHNDKSGAGLSHEQYHFHIVELFTRQIRKAVAARQITIGNTDVFNKYLQQIWVEVLKMQQEYDAETNHSQNAVRQKFWEEKVDAGLKYMDHYR